MNERWNGFIDNVGRLFRRYSGGGTFICIGLKSGIKQASVVTWQCESNELESGALMLLESAKAIGERDNNLDCVARCEAAVLILRDTVSSLKILPANTDFSAGFSTSDPQD